MRAILLLLAALSAHAGDPIADPVQALFDLPADSWRETPPLTAKLTKHSGKVPLRITVHYTDEPKMPDRTLMVKLRGLYNYSIHTIEGTKKKLWGDIPYHFFIDSGGLLGECRSPIYMPDSNTAYARDGHITIVVEGNEKDGINDDQKTKLFALIEALQAKYKIPTSRVGVHLDFAQTDCPGTAVKAAVTEFKEAHPD
ncbi:MAG: peptidoglycan recognition protein family protein [Bdellovibrionota bacterium]